VKDFGRSWRDGYAFNALNHRIRPELVDMSRLAQQPNRVNLENAFSTAETHLGIPRLLDPEGFRRAQHDRPHRAAVRLVAAARRVAEANAVPFNPLFLQGATGLGKPLKSKSS